MMSPLAFMLAAALSTSGPTGAPALLPPPIIPPATLDDSLEVTGDALDARVIVTRMAVEVMVNGAGPFRFVVDSGADRSVIGSGLADRLGLPIEGSVTLHGMAGSSRVGTVRLASLRVGASEMPDIRAPALPERFLGAQGLVGIDALAEQRLMLDFDKATITVQPSRKVEPVREGEIVVTARRRHGQLILTEVGIGTAKVYAVIDTGAQVTIGNSALLARVLRGRRPPPLKPVTLISVTGQSIEAGVMVLPEVKIGALILKHVPVAFTDAPPFALFGLAEQPAMLLGTDVLEVFRRVALDFRARKVRFVMR